MDKQLRRYRFVGRAGTKYVWHGLPLRGDSRVEEIRCSVEWFWSVPAKEPSIHPLQFPADATEWERARYAGFLAVCGQPQTTFEEWRARQVITAYLPTVEEGLSDGQPSSASSW